MAAAGEALVLLAGNARSRRAPRDASLSALSNWPLDSLRGKLSENVGLGLLLKFKLASAKRLLGQTLLSIVQ
jgi:hypothetical protein